MSSNGPYQEIVDFLINPENIESALDIAEIVPSVIDRLHTKFWETLKTSVERQLSKAGVTNWTVSFAADSRDPLKDQYFYLDIGPSPTPDQNWYISFWLQQDYNRGRMRSHEPTKLYYGYGFPNGKSPKPFNKLPSTVKELCNVTNDWIFYKNQSKDGWVAGRVLDCDIRGRREIILEAQGDNFESEICDIFVALFLEKRKAVEKVNAALSNWNP